MEELKNLRKELGNFKLSLLYIGIGLCIIIAIVLVILDACIENTTLPILLILTVLLPCVFIVMMYYLYLGALRDMKQELKANECITPDISRQLLLNAIQEVKDSNLETLEQKESQLDTLKKRAYKTSNPFLIRKYLNEKLDFEWESFQIEMIIEYLNGDVINRLKETQLLVDRIEEQKET